MWHTNDEFNKMMFRTRVQIAGILKPLELYGQKEAVVGAVEAIMEVIDLFGQRVRGKDIPILLIDKPYDDVVDLLRRKQ